MNDMIERVARAICAKTNIATVGETEVIYDNPDYVIPARARVDGIPIPRWRLYLDQARAAIEATGCEISEIERLASGEYTLCDGRCDGY